MSIRFRAGRRFGHIRVGPVELVWGRWAYSTAATPFICSIYIGERWAIHPIRAGGGGA